MTRPATYPVVVVLLAMAPGCAAASPWTAPEAAPKHGQWSEARIMVPTEDLAQVTEDAIQIIEDVAGCPVTYGIEVQYPDEGINYAVPGYTTLQWVPEYAKWDENLIGWARWRVYEERADVIAQTWIALKDEEPRLEVVIHEILHALGLRHAKWGVLASSPKHGVDSFALETIQGLQERCL